MPTPIEIVLKATDNASKVLKDTSKNIGDVESASGKLSGAFKLLTSAAIGGAVIKFFSDSLSYTTEYASQVRELSRNIGATTEESSRLIQVADDLEISEGALEGALKAAIRKGIEPSIENLGKLADEYLAIQDPIARTKFLMDNFGRSGADLGALMEQGSQGIHDMGKEADATGLIMSQEGVESARQYALAVDGLQDSWHGMQVALSQEVMPTLTAAANTLVLLVTWNKRLADATDTTSQSIADGAESLDDYNAQMDDLEKRSKSAIHYVGEVAGKQLYWNSQTLRFVDAAEAAARGIDRMTDAEITNAIELRNMTDEVDKGAIKAYEAAAAWTNYVGVVASGTDILKSSKDEAAAMADVFGGQTTPMLAAVKAQADLTSPSIAAIAAAFDAVRAAQKSWSDSAATDVQGALEAAGIKGDDLVTALGAIDDKYGTGLANQEAYKTKLSEISDEFAQTGDLEAFQAGLDTLDATFSPDGMQAKIDNTKARLLALGEEGFIAEVSTGGGVNRYQLGIDGLVHQVGPLGLGAALGSAQGVTIATGKVWRAETDPGSGLSVYTESVQHVTDLLAALPTAITTTWTFVQNGTPPETAPGGGGGGGSPQHKGPGGQHGLDMIVPPGYSGDRYPVYASSGERVTVQTQAQQQAGGGGAINVTLSGPFYLATPGGMTPRQFARMLQNELRRAP